MQGKLTFANTVEQFDAGNCDGGVVEASLLRQRLSRRIDTPDESKSSGSRGKGSALEARRAKLHEPLSPYSALQGNPGIVAIPWENHWS
jgi:hypothetical protein